MKANPDADYVTPLTPSERGAIQEAKDAVKTRLPLSSKAPSILPRPAGKRTSHVTASPTLLR